MLQIIRFLQFYMNHDRSRMKTYIWDNILCFGWIFNLYLYSYTRRWE